MIYSNVFLSAKKVMVGDNTKYRLSIGAYERRGVPLYLFCQDNTVILQGENYEYIFDDDGSIKKEASDDVYMILSSEGKRLSCNYGRVYVSDPNSIKIIKSGFYDISYKGNVDIFALKITGETWIGIKRPGYSMSYIYIKDNRIYSFKTVQESSIWADSNNIIVCPSFEDIDNWTELHIDHTRYMKH